MKVTEIVAVGVNPFPSMVTMSATYPLDSLNEIAGRTVKDGALTLGFAAASVPTSVWAPWTSPAGTLNVHPEKLPKEFVGHADGLETEIPPSVKVTAEEVAAKPAPLTVTDEPIVP